MRESKTRKYPYTPDKNNHFPGPYYTTLHHVRSILYAAASHLSAFFNTPTNQAIPQGVSLLFL
jgi:hypothetical protein